MELVANTYAGPAAERAVECNGLRVAPWPTVITWAERLPADGIEGKCKSILESADKPYTRQLIEPFSSQLELTLRSATGESNFRKFQEL
ncbi:MAG: hypothetical protein QNJ40_12850 [Xanthomonadales bacterium]|nr:hypothetical protein [Xanthomonadales bacterium]